MNFKEKSNLFKIKKIIKSKLMGELFKVIFAYKLKKKFFRI